MGNWCETSVSQSVDPCLWYKICVHSRNVDEKAKIQGLYRRVAFIDIPKYPQTNTESKQYEEIAKNDYNNHYKSCNNVYVRVYDQLFREIDQKRELVFLWNDGNRWIFSNYESLHFYVDIKLGPQYVIQIFNPQTNIAMLSNEYSTDFDQLKMLKKIKYENEKGVHFRLTISNTFSLNEDIEAQNENKQLQETSPLKHSQLSENSALRQTFIQWKANINIYYQRSQLLTKQQRNDEQIKQNNKMKADKVRNIIEEINVICLSAEFRKLVKKYKHESRKINGWVHNDNGLKTIINDENYNEFNKEYIQRKRNDQLAFDFVQDIALEFNTYYRGLIDELKNFENGTEGMITFK